MFKMSQREAAAFFDGETFNRYRVQFNIIFQYIMTADMVIMDEANRAAVVFPKASTPIVWIDESLFKEEAVRVLDKLIRYLFDEYIELNAAWVSPFYSESFAVCYKKYFGCSYEKIVTQTAYFCDRLVNPEFRGELLAAMPENLKTVAKYMKNFEKECFDQQVGDEEILKKAADFAKMRQGFLWKDGNDFTALGFISHKSKTQGRINYIYVAEEFRGNGYAKMITAKLAEIILNEGLKPVLYAIDGYEASNRAYQRIGFAADKKTEKIAFGTVEL